MREHLDAAEARQITDEYWNDYIKPIVGNDFDDFKEWVNEETNWAVFESCNRSWINTKTLRVIGTQTLYNLYLTTCR